MCYVNLLLTFDIHQIHTRDQLLLGLVDHTCSLCLWISDCAVLNSFGCLCPKCKCTVAVFTYSNFYCNMNFRCRHEILALQIAAKALQIAWLIELSKH